MSKETLWVFGIDYLEQCSTEGSGAIELFLSKMNIKNEKSAMKILNVIRNKNLLEVGRYIFELSEIIQISCVSIIINCFSIIEKELCRVQSKKSFNNGRFGNALDWALRSQDTLYVTSIADRFLRVSFTNHYYLLQKIYILFKDLYICY